MNFWEFADRSPFAVVFLALFATIAVSEIFGSVSRAFRRKCDCQKKTEAPNG
jgi:hypothetical protein